MTTVHAHREGHACNDRCRQERNRSLVVLTVAVGLLWALGVTAAYLLGASVARIVVTHIEAAAFLTAGWCVVGEWRSRREKKRQARRLRWLEDVRARREADEWEMR